MNQFLLTLFVLFTTFKVNANKFPNAGDAYQALELNNSISFWQFKNAYNHFKRYRGLETTFSIIDYTKPSSEKRFWVFDMAQRKVAFSSYVTHGVNSGRLFAKNFSNKVDSRKTSVGIFRSAETYEGIHGYSLRLDGLSTGYNDNARNRAIVIHGADYAHPNTIRQSGQLGTSWGCPALPTYVSSEIIDKIKHGTFIYAFPMP